MLRGANIFQDLLMLRVLHELQATSRVVFGWRCETESWRCETESDGGRARSRCKHVRYREGATYGMIINLI